MHNCTDQTFYLSGHTNYLRNVLKDIRVKTLSINECHLQTGESTGRHEEPSNDPDRRMTIWGGESPPPSQSDKASPPNQQISPHIWPTSNRFEDSSKVKDSSGKKVKRDLQTKIDLLNAAKDRHTRAGLAVARSSHNHQYWPDSPPHFGLGGSKLSNSAHDNY